VPRLLLLAAIAAVIYILYQRASIQPPHKRRSELIKLGTGVAVGLVIILTLTGRMHWVGAALTGLLVGARQLLPTLIRLFPVLASLKGRSASQSGAQQSTVATEVLRMHLDHSSGKLNGEVLKGPFKDWYLDELDRQQLDELLRYCQQEDADSAQLLQGYMEQRFPDDDIGAATGQDRQGATDTAGGMTRREALSILGLGDDATEKDIIAAHRTLMQKLHPDRGGNDYLAAKINEAKDFLLG
jgi:hypothetical protein